MVSESVLAKKLRLIELGLAGLLREAEEGSMINTEDVKLLYEEVAMMSQDIAH